MSSPCLHQRSRQLGLVSPPPVHFSDRIKAQALLKLHKVGAHWIGRRQLFERPLHQKLAHTREALRYPAPLLLTPRRLGIGRLLSVWKQSAPAEFSQDRLPVAAVPAGHQHCAVAVPDFQSAMSAKDTGTAVAVLRHAPQAECGCQVGGAKAIASRVFFGVRWGWCKDFHGSPAFRPPRPRRAFDFQRPVSRSHCSSRALDTRNFLPTRFAGSSPVRSSL